MKKVVIIAFLGAGYYDFFLYDMPVGLVGGLEVA